MRMNKMRTVLFCFSVIWIFGQIIAEYIMGIAIVVWSFQVNALYGVVSIFVVILLGHILMGFSLLPALIIMYSTKENK